MAGRPLTGDLSEQARLAEEAGFDWLVLGDRRAWGPGFNEALTTLAWLAARTDRIGLATAGLILPLYPPVLVAEALANIDVLSGGRLTAGFVLGYRPEEFSAFGVEPRRRVTLFERGLEAVRSLWVDGRAEVGGSEVRIGPLPLQRPHPPIWGAGRVDAAIRRTAALCDGWTSSFNEEPDDLAAKIHVYREAARGGGEVIVCRDGFCAEGAGRARSTLEPPLLDLLRDYAGWKRASADADRYRDLSWETLRPRLLVGDPDEFSAQLGRYQAMGADGVILRLQPPLLGHAETMRCIELLGREVLPRFRRERHLTPPR
ncbi:MAG TPA: LLM class flavin-dependent oxidoreductase [Candidatus Dormibacteraeota bacterium]|nr:LLM class flavin-dependent oxidoreductase [Candidatus Dormibacteraeota bacterium]